MNSPTPGARFRAALAAERPLQIAGAIHAYAAMLAERAGFRALYLSGAGVANASCGIPDLGFTTLDDVLTDVRRIVGATKLPLLVDADTGWGDPAATVRAMIVAPDHALQAPQSRTGGADKLQNAAQAVLCRRGRTGLTSPAISSEMRVVIMVMR